MPEKVRRIRKKKSASTESVLKSKLLSDSGQHQLKDADAHNVDTSPQRKKRKKRRTSQKHEEASKRIQKKSFFVSFIILSILATIFAISFLRFLHLNGPDYDQTFLNKVEGQYTVSAEIKGLSISPKSLNVSTLLLKHDEEIFLFKEIELNTVKAVHNGHGLVGLNWKGPSIEAESGISILNLKYSSSLNQKSEANFIDFISYSIEDFTFSTQHHNLLVENTEFAITQQRHAILEGGSINLPLLNQGLSLNNIYIDDVGRIDGEINNEEGIIDLKGFFKNKTLELKLAKVNTNTLLFNEAQQHLLGTQLELNTYLYSATEKGVNVSAQVKKKISSVPFDIEEKILSYISLNGMADNSKNLTLSTQIIALLQENELSGLSLSSLELKSLSGYSYHIHNIEDQQSFKGFIKFEPFLEERLMNFSTFYSLLEKRKDGLYLPLVFKYDNGLFLDNLDILLFKKATGTKLKTRKALEAELNSLLE